MCGYYGTDYGAGGDDDYATQQHNDSYDSATAAPEPVPMYNPAEQIVSGVPKPVPAPVAPPNYGANNGYGEPHGVPPPAIKYGKKHSCYQRR